MARERSRERGHGRGHKILTIGSLVGAWMVGEEVELAQRTNLVGKMRWRIM